MSRIRHATEEFVINAIDKIKTILGDETLETTSQIITGAINEINDDVEILESTRGYVNIKDIGVSNIDNLRMSGKFTGDPTGMPTNGVWVFNVTARSINWVYQKARCMYDLTGRGYTGVTIERDCIDNTWQEWKQIATTTKTEILATDMRNGWGLNTNYPNSISISEGMATVFIFLGSIGTKTGGIAICQTQLRPSKSSLLFLRSQQNQSFNCWLNVDGSIVIDPQSADTFSGYWGYLEGAVIL